MDLSSSPSSSSSTSLNLNPNSYLSNNGTPPKHLPLVPPSPTLVQYLLGFSVSTIPMNNHSGTILEDGEIFDSKVSLPALGAAFSREKKSVKPQQRLEISLSKAHIEPEPNLIVINCGDYQQMTSASPSKEDFETDSDLTVTLETSPTLQIHSPSAESVLTVIKDGAGSIQPENESKTELEISQTNYSVILQENCSDAAAISQTNAKSVDSADASKAASNGREDRESPELPKVEFKSTDVTTNGSQKEAEPTPLNRDEPAKTPSGEAPQDLMLRLLIQKKPTHCATMAKDSPSQSPVVSNTIRPQHQHC